MPVPQAQAVSGDAESVCVAVKLRPLVPSELEQGSRECLLVTPGMPQVSTGQHVFTYDHVYGGDCGAEPTQLYATCVAPLVEGLFKGYNATVFAYGQTGSGKTYTMGSEYRPGGPRAVAGVIPEAISAIFNKIAGVKDWQCTVRVSFVEIHKEEVRDLLVNTPGPRAAVSIREVLGGGVCLYGAVEKEVRSQEEMAAVLETGTLCRATASTSMNNRSSRSHAIFTITLEQKRQVAGPGTPSATTSTVTGRDDDDDDEGDVGPGEGEDALDDYLCAKMHLVDLAGSERAKRTKAEGARLKEGIHINRGLLALGNVINAIVDQHKHIPYRDSKLTRLLQDSLGGNSRTVMIACVSPADINFEESLNTLRYADRARHIRNKPIINRDPVAAQVAFLRQQIAALRAENLALKAALAADGKSLGEEGVGPAGGPHWAIVEQLQQENTSLELDNTRLKMKVEDVGRELEAVQGKCYLLQASLDRVNAEVRLMREGTSAGPSSGGGADMEVDGEEANGSSGGAQPATANAHDMVVATYVARIAELEKELRAARQFGSMRRRMTSLHSSSSQREAGTGEPPCTPGSGGMGMHTPGPGQGPMTCSPTPGTVDEGDGVGEHEDGPGEAEEEMYYAEMAAHALEQEKMKSELVALQRLLESKERRMAELQVGSGQVPALKQHYDRVLVALQRERDELMSEKVAIMQKLQHLQASSEEERKRLEAAYKDKLATMDDKLRSLRHKEREFVSMQKLKQRTEDMCRRLSGDITRIKQQKVALQKNMEASAKQFAQWRQDREKELLQLRKQARRSAAQIQALEALQAKQNAVLQRKIADANAARKRLREMQEMSARTSALANGHAREAAARVSADSTQAGAPGGLLSSSLEVQPNASAPLLRTEKARREWVDKELDLCNQSYEYRRVLEGELAQRAEVNRQLRNVMKRLMMVNNLTPASPLLPGPGGAVTPCGPAQVGDAVSQQLQERRATLERQLAEHNAQIAELQGAWERAKAEEEGRGGGAADSRRWTGIRSVVEARELLRTVFRVASDLKANNADSALEGLKLCEENDLLKVQLDAARKEAEAQRKRAAAIEATAATAMATPFPPTLTMSGKAAAARADAQARASDETDQEVDDLLLQLHRAKTPQMGGLDEEGPRLGSPDGSVEVSVDRSVAALPGSFSNHNTETTGTSSEQDGHAAKLSLVKQLDTQSFDQGTQSQPAGRAAGGGGGGGSQQAPRASKHNRGEHGEAEDTCEEEEEEEGEEDSEDDEEEDHSWDPSQATPARGAAGRRTSGRLRAAAAAGGAPGTSAAQHSGGTASAAGRASRRRSGSVGPASICLDPVAQQQQAALEAAVLSDLNRGRVARGLPAAEKVTVQLMKDSLRERIMPDGKPWKAGSKTRDQLLADYAAILGLSTSLGVSLATASSSQGVHLQVPCLELPLGPRQLRGSSALEARAPHTHQHHHQLPPALSARQRSATGADAYPLAGPSLLSMRQHPWLYASTSAIPGVHMRPISTSAFGSPHAHGSQPASPFAADGARQDPLLSQARDYRAAVLSPRDSPAHKKALSQGSSPTNSYFGQGDGYSSGQPHEAAEAGTGGMTPMSLLYIQKAQEARKRMADMRQHMSHGSQLLGSDAGPGEGGGASPHGQHSPHALSPGAQLRHTISWQELPRNSARQHASEVSLGGYASQEARTGSGSGAANSSGTQQQQQSPSSGHSTPGQDRGGRGPRASGSPLNSGRRPSIWR